MATNRSTCVSRAVSWMPPSADGSRLAIELTIRFNSPVREGGAPSAAPVMTAINSAREAVLSR